MSSFDFGLQFLDTDHMTYQGKRRDANFWIENAAVEWPEAQAPFHTVARLTLLAKSELSADALRGRLHRRCQKLHGGQRPGRRHQPRAVARGRGEPKCSSGQGSQQVEDSGMRGGT